MFRSSVVLALTALLFVPFTAGAQSSLLRGTVTDAQSAPIIKIDHVVLDPHNHSIQKLIVSAKDGAVRWISGNSMSGAYRSIRRHY